MVPEPLFDLGDWAGDPLHPDTETVTPAELVARMGPTDRRHRVRALINQADDILSDALHAHTEGRNIVATCLLWSGGNDSNTLAHLMRHNATHAVHANTGIGIEATRQFVRDQCAMWDLPLIEKHPPAGSTYREIVLDQGFPGPAHHWKMYQRLKERALRQARADLVKDPRRERIVFLAGRRRAESDRRGDVPLFEREGSVIWVSPLAMWTKLDLNTYRTMHDDVPHNPVVDHLHMSGECLCGAFAKPDEREQIRDWSPETDAAITELESAARAIGIPEPRCRWGWGADTKARASDRVGRLCTSCTLDLFGEAA